MWTPFNKTSVRIVIYIIVLWTPFNKSSVRIVIYIIVMWIPFSVLLRCTILITPLVSSNSSSHSYRGFVEQCPQDNDRFNNSHRGFVERCPQDNNKYNNSHRGFVERYPHDNIRIRTSKKNRLYNGQKEKYKRQTTIYKTYT
jgi:hypothetical protein